MIVSVWILFTMAMSIDIMASCLKANVTVLFVTELIRFHQIRTDADGLTFL